MGVSRTMLRNKSPFLKISYSYIFFRLCTYRTAPYVPLFIPHVNKPYRSKILHQLNLLLNMSWIVLQSLLLSYVLFSPSLSLYEIEYLQKFLCLFLSLSLFLLLSLFISLSLSLFVVFSHLIASLLLFLSFCLILSVI